MKRLIFSIFSGIIFPIIYLVVTGTISDWVSPRYEYLFSMQVAGEALMGPVLAPIAVPFWIYNYLRFYNYLGFWYIFDTFWFRIIWFTSFNFLLYFGVFYLLFRHFNLFKRPENSVINREPPLPPQFSD